MAAIITDGFRRNAAQVFVDDITAGNGPYYMGIGKSDPYDSQSGVNEDNASFVLSQPVASKREEINVLNNLTTINRVGTSSAYRLVPRINFATGKKYKIYDPGDANCFFAEGDLLPCMVMNSDREIFLVLDNGKTTGDPATTVTGDTPVATATGNDIITSTATTGEKNGLIVKNNYRYAYICTLNRDSGFFTNQFAAIGAIGSTPVVNTAYAVGAGPDDSTGGLIYGFAIDNGGTGYGTPTVKIRGRKYNTTSNKIENFTSTPTVTIREDGGVIKHITINLSSGDILRTNLIGVIAADVVISGGGGSGAVVRPLIAPLEGFGGDILNQLPTYYAGVKAEFEDDLSGDGLIIPFRQISLIRGASFATGDTPDDAAYAPGDVAKALRYLSDVNTDPELTPGDLIWDNDASATTYASADLADSDDNAVAIFDHYDATLNRVYYHQNNDSTVDQAHVNTLEFADTGIVYLGHKNQGSIPSEYTQFNYAEYSAFKESNTVDSQNEFGKQNGEVLFIENRKKVTRAADQIEEVRMIIQF